MSSDGGDKDDRGSSDLKMHGRSSRGYDLHSRMRSVTANEEHLDLTLDDLEELEKEEFCVDLESPNTIVKTLRLNDSDLSERCRAALTTALSSKTSPLTELHLNGIKFLEDSGVKLLFDALGSEHCKLKTLRLTHCELKEENCASLVFAFESDSSHLKELDLSLNHLQDTGVKLLCAVLRNPLSTLEKLNLVDCGLTKQSCASLASIFESEHSHLKELDLSLNLLRDSGVKSLCSWLRKPSCTLESLRLLHCKLTKHSCAALASTFKSQPSRLKVLDLTGNHLMDSGTRVLCSGLKNPYCTLKTLKLSHCGLSKSSCGYLSPVLKSNPSHLRELDLSFNCLQDDGILWLSDGLSNPNCGLSKLWLNYCDLSDRGCAAVLTALKKHFLYPFLLDIRGNELSYEEMMLLETVKNSSDSGAHLLRVKCVSLKEGRDISSQIPLKENTEAELELLINKLLGEGEKHSDAALQVSDSERAAESPPEVPASPSSTLSSPPLSPDDDTQLTPDSTGGNTDLGWSETNKGPFCFEPKLLYEHGGISYRFRGLGPGVFLCKLTGLGFTMTRGGELFYKTIQWDEDLLQSAGKLPAGPLFKIEGVTNAVSQLHLLHCEQNPTALPNGLSAVHMGDEGMSILEPLEINNTHVVVDVSHFSGFGLVRDFFRGILNFQKPISSQVLLFHRPTWTDTSQKVNVFMLPKNVPLEEVKQQQENADYIEATSSCHLIKDQTYTLQCPEAKLVQPASALFDLKYGPNYHPAFEMRFNLCKSEATVTVRNQQAKSVWEYRVDLTPKAGVKSASSSTSLSALPAASEPTAAATGGDSEIQDMLASLDFSSKEEKRLFSIRKGFIDRVSGSVVKSLLDVLLHREVINYDEKDNIQAKQQERDTAEALIDMILKKGEPACKIMIDAFCKLDPFVSATLKLTQKDGAHV